MAKRILYIFNYQREIPPFMIPQIEEAVRRYDEVRYLSPSLTNDRLFADKDRYRNLHFIIFSKSVRAKQYLKGIMCLLFPRFWKKVAELGFSKANIKNVAKEAFCIAGIEAVSRRDISAALKRGDEVTVMAAWFNLCAVAAARVKRLHPEVEAESFAHAFEIDAERDNFDYRAFAREKHSLLDRVHFISRVKLENYYRSTDYLGIREQYGDKVQVSYLGSPNTSKILNPENNESRPFELVTCSRTSPEKRLPLLAEALRGWQLERPLHWTHLGDGPLQPVLQRATERLMAANPKVTVTLAGAKTNAEVHEHYRGQPVDLFVNVSDTEGLPVSIMEASSYGIPCAATDVGGTRELVDSSMGWLMEKDFKGADICRQIEEFASRSAEERGEMRRNARRIWAENFDAEKTIPALWDGVESRQKELLKK